MKDRKIDNSPVEIPMTVGVHTFPFVQYVSVIRLHETHRVFLKLTGANGNVIIYSPNMLH